jgi:Spx/MgsR family transcriptional regulator
LTITIYGIKNCDTVKKARAWLDGRGVNYRFHDYRADGLDPGLLRFWCDTLGWEILLNRASTTFRNLPDSEKQGVDADRAMALMIAQPSMIKRPVLDAGGRLTVGFKPERYESMIAGF